MRVIRATPVATPVATRRKGRRGRADGPGHDGSPVDAQDLLTEPTARAARAVALFLLDVLDAEYGRLGRKGDADALHDFRVALRRLRSWVRAYRRDLRACVGRKDMRRLGALARVTTDSRDTEVHLEWIAAQRKTLSPASRVGARHLTRRLNDGKARSDAALRATLETDFAGLSGKLRKKLVRHALAVPGQSPGDCWAATAATQVQDAFADLRQRLGAIAGENDDGTAHRARIAGKRLRYLLEPLSGPIDRVRDCVEALKRLQDLLGSIHDAHVFGYVLRRHVRVHAKHSRGRAVHDPRTGLRTLEARLGARRSSAWIEFSQTWMTRDAAALSGAIPLIVQELREIGGAGVEIERKYLLRFLPVEVAGASAAEIEQGYLPGAKLIERVRRTKTAAGVRYVRTVKSGAGMVRTELEEPCTYSMFRALWPLTKGRRIRKRRYRMADAGRVWEIDQFLEQDLVLAEVELTSPRDDVTIPEWLAPCLVREVTGEPEYLNATLAR